MENPFIDMLGNEVLCGDMFRSYRDVTGVPSGPWMFRLGSQAGPWDHVMGDTTDLNRLVRSLSIITKHRKLARL